MTSVVLDEPRVPLSLPWLVAGVAVAVAAVIAFSLTREAFPDPLVRQAQELCAEEVGDQASDVVVRRGDVWTVGDACTLVRADYNWQVVDVRG